MNKFNVSLNYIDTDSKKEISVKKVLKVDSMENVIEIIAQEYANIVFIEIIKEEV